MLRRILFFLLCACVLRADETTHPLLIAAAADMKFALDDVLVQFRKIHADQDAKPTYGSSGTLFAQIDNGAPFDLFLSADAKYPQQLIERGKAERGTLFTYAFGHLVVWVPKNSPLDFAHRGAKALLDPSVKKIAVANPSVAPYGAAAVAALKKLGVYDDVSGKLVIGENVAQAAQFAQLGAAEAGIVSLSLALSPKMKDAGSFWEIPTDAFPKMEQVGVIVADSANRAGAVQFREFLTSRDGREILKLHGFSLPENAK